MKAEKINKITKPAVVFLLIFNTALIIFLAVISRGEDYITISRHTFDNISYDSSAGSADLSTPKELGIPNRNGLQRLSVSFEMEVSSFQENSNVFQTAAENKGIRLQLSEGQNLVLITGYKNEDHYKEFMLSDSIEKGQWYNVEISLDYSKHITVMLNDELVLDTTEPDMSIEVSEIAVGTGYSKTRRFDGRITDFNLNYRLIARKTPVFTILSLIEVILVFFLILIFSKRAIHKYDYMLLAFACLVFTIYWMDTLDNIVFNYNYIDEAYTLIGAQDIADNHNLIVPSMLDYSFTRAYFVAPVFMIFGSFNIFAVRLIFIISVWVSIFLIYRISIKLFNSRYIGIFSAFSFVLLYTSKYELFDVDLYPINGEVMLVFPKILGLYLFTTGYTQRDRIVKSGIFMLLSGMTITLILLVRIDNSGILFVYIFILILAEVLNIYRTESMNRNRIFWKAEIKRLSINLTAFLSGTILFFIAIMIISGDFDRFIYKYFFISFITSTSQNYDANMARYIEDLGNAIKRLFANREFFSISFILFIPHLFISLKKKKVNYLFIFLLICIAVLGMSLSQRLFYRFNLGIYPFLAIGMGIGWGLFYQHTKDYLRRFPVVIFIFIIFFLSLYIPRLSARWFPFVNYRDQIPVFEMQSDFQKEVKGFFQDDNFYMAGSTWGFYLYVFAEKIPPASLIGQLLWCDYRDQNCQNPFFDIEKIISDLEENRPEYILFTPEYYYLDRNCAFVMYVKENYSKSDELTGRLNDIIIKYGLDEDEPGLFDVYVLNN